MSCNPDKIVASRYKPSTLPYFVNLIQYHAELMKIYFFPFMVAQLCLVAGFLINRSPNLVSGQNGNLSHSLLTNASFQELRCVNV